MLALYFSTSQKKLAMKYLVYIFLALLVLNTAIQAFRNGNRQTMYISIFIVLVLLALLILF